MLVSHRENRYSADTADTSNGKKRVTFGEISSAKPQLTLVTLILLLDRIEMLHFRSSVALKELFQSQLKRPLTGAGGSKASPAAYCFSTVGLDVRSPARGQPAAGWKPPQHWGRKLGVRAFCSKGDGHNEANKDSAAEK